MIYFGVYNIGLICYDGFEVPTKWINIDMMFG